MKSGIHVSMMYYNYLLFFIMLALYSLFDNRVDYFYKRLFLIVSFALAFFSSTQYGLGDYFNYQELYESYQWEHFSFPFFNSYLHAGTGHEWLYVILGLISKEFLLLDYDVYFVLFVSIVLTLKVKFLSRFTVSFLFSVFLYICFMMLQDMYVLRSSVANILVFYSFIHLSKRSYAKFLILIFIASGFHIFSLFALLVPFVKNGKFIIVVFITSILLTLFTGGALGVVKLFSSIIPFSDYIVNRIEMGVDNEKFLPINIFGFGTIFLLSLAFYFIWKIRNISRLSEGNYLYIMVISYLMSVSMYIFFSDLSLLAYRSLELYGIFSIIILVSSSDRYANQIESFFLKAYTGLYALIMFYLKINEVGPYDSII